MRRIVFPVLVIVVALWPAAAVAQPKEPPAPAEQVVLSGDVVAVDGSVQLGETAQVTGSVLAGGEISAGAGAQVGGDSRQNLRWTLGGTLEPLGSLLPPAAIAVSVLLAALLWLLVAPRGGDGVGRALATAPLASIGWGLLVTLVLPVLGLVATVTVVGLPFGLALLLGLGLVWLVGLAAAVWGIGRLIVREPRSRIGAVMAGWLVATVVGLVPYVNVAWWVFVHARLAGVLYAEDR